MLWSRWQCSCMFLCWIFPLTSGLQLGMSLSMLLLLPCLDLLIQQSAQLTASFGQLPFIHFILTMGNQACCDVRNTDYQQTYIPEEKAKQQEEPVSEQPQTKEEHPQPPETNPPVQARLAHYKEREDRLGENPNVRSFGKEYYQGQLDAENRFPSGFGKIYKADGSVYLGEWEQGKAKGTGVYVMQDGAFYEGHFEDNRAEGQGKFTSGHFNFEGHFRNNKFHGIGTEKDQQHTYHGDFDQGHKVKGTFTWNEDGKEYEYNGDFNEQGEFHGKGKLTEPNGNYQGQFVKGEKHGKGQYSFGNGLRYEGDYDQGKKEGRGIIFNNNETIAYEGEFSNNIPHGQGNIYTKDGTKLRRKWVEGIDSGSA